MLLAISPVKFKQPRTLLGSLTIILSSGLLTACDSSDNVGECSATEQQDYFRNLFRYEYLYNAEVADRIENNQYDTLEEMVYGLRYEPYDTYSYITSTEEYDDSLTHESFLYGVNWIFSDSNDSLIIRSAAPNSPAEAAGLVRGDKVIALGGVAVFDIYNAVGLGLRPFSDFIGDSDSSTPVTFKWQTLEGNIVEKEIARATFQYDKVHHLSYLDANSGKVAYFVYDEFSEESSEELKTTFAAIKQQNPEHLILDLRYNPGGFINVSNQLASSIAGDKISNQIYRTVSYNQYYRDDTDYFDYDEIKDVALNLEKVFILTTEASCSSSELVINGLKPYIDVEIIGETTCGKPLGSFSHDYCGQTLSLIELESTNADGEGGYHNGLAPTCYVEDQPTYPFGDIRDAATNRAMSMIDGAQCPPQPAAGTVAHSFGNRLLDSTIKPYILTNPDHKVRGKPSTQW
jgi:C-terminal processing protease CtpA/Prc